MNQNTVGFQIEGDPGNSSAVLQKLASDYAAVKTSAEATGQALDRTAKTTGDSEGAAKSAAAEHERLSTALAHGAAEAAVFTAGLLGIGLGLKELAEETIGASIALDDQIVKYANWSGTGQAAANALGESFSHNFGLGVNSAAALVGALSPVSGILADNAKGALSNADAESTMASAQRLSVETGAALMDTTRAVVEVRRTYGLTAEDNTRIEQALYEAMRLTGTGAAEVGAALGLIHSRLQPFNVDLDTSNALLITSARSGAEGSRQLMAMASSLTTLLRPTAAQAEELDKLQVGLYDTSGALRPLPDILDSLGSSLDKLSPKEQISAEQAIFGATGFTRWYDAMAAGGSITAQVDKDLVNQAIHAKDAYTAVHTLGAEWEIAKAGSENFAASMGSHLLVMFEAITAFTLKGVAAGGGYIAMLGKMLEATNPAGSALHGLGANLESSGHDFQQWADKSSTSLSGLARDTNEAINGVGSTAVATASTVAASAGAVAAAVAGIFRAASGGSQGVVDYSAADKAALKESDTAWKAYITARLAGQDLLAAKELEIATKAGTLSTEQIAALRMEGQEAQATYDAEVRLAGVRVDAASSGLESLRKLGDAERAYIDLTTGGTSAMLVVTAASIAKESDKAAAFQHTATTVFPAYEAALANLANLQAQLAQTADPAGQKELQKGIEEATRQVTALGGAYTDASGQAKTALSTVGTESTKLALQMATVPEAVTALRGGIASLASGGVTNLQTLGQAYVSLQTSQNALHTTIDAESGQLAGLVQQYKAIQSAGQENSVEGTRLRGTIVALTSSLVSNTDSFTANAAAQAALRASLGDAGAAHAELADKLGVTLTAETSLNQKWDDTVSLLRNVKTAAGEASLALKGIVSAPSQEELGLQSQLASLDLQIAERKQRTPVGSTAADPTLARLEAERTGLQNSIGVYAAHRAAVAAQADAQGHTALTSGQMVQANDAATASWSRGVAPLAGVSSAYGGLTNSVTGAVNQIKGLPVSINDALMAAAPPAEAGANAVGSAIYTGIMAPLAALSVGLGSAVVTALASLITNPAPLAEEAAVVSALQGSRPAIPTHGTPGAAPAAAYGPPPSATGPGSVDTTAPNWNPAHPFASGDEQQAAAEAAGQPAIHPGARPTPAGVSTFGSSGAAAGPYGDVPQGATLGQYPIAGNMGWSSPLAGSPLITQGFGPTNFAQTTNYEPNHFHQGLDLNASGGAIEKAVHDGVVTAVHSDPSDPTLNKVLIDIGGAIVTYMHLLPSVKEGQKVGQGDTIGTVYGGSGAASTGPHLHIEFDLPEGGVHGGALNPFDVLSGLTTGVGTTHFGSGDPAAAAAAATGASVAGDMGQQVKQWLMNAGFTGQGLINALRISSLETTGGNGWDPNVLEHGKTGVDQGRGLFQITPRWNPDVTDFSPQAEANWTFAQTHGGNKTSDWYGPGGGLFATAPLLAQGIPQNIIDLAGGSDKQASTANKDLIASLDAVPEPVSDLTTAVTTAFPPLTAALKGAGAVVDEPATKGGLLGSANTITAGIAASGKPAGDAAAASIVAAGPALGAATAHAIVAAIPAPVIGPTTYAPPSGSGSAYTTPSQTLPPQSPSFVSGNAQLGLSAQQQFANQAQQQASANAATDRANAASAAAVQTAASNAAAQKQKDDAIAAAGPYADALKSLQNSVTAAQMLDDQTNLRTAGLKVQLSNLNEQSSVLTGQITLSQDLLAASGQTDATNPELAALQVERDKLVIQNLNTLDVDTRIAKITNQNKLAADELALTNIGLTVQTAVKRVAEDRLSITIAQNSAMNEETAILQAQLKILQEMNSLAIFANTQSTGHSQASSPAQFQSVPHASGGTLAEDVIGIGRSSGAIHTFERGESINPVGGAGFGGLNMAALSNLVVTIIGQIASQHIEGGRRARADLAGAFA